MSSGLSKNFYSKSSPDLVSFKSVNDINNDMFSEPIIIGDNSNTGCFNSNIYNFYKKYIQPNLIAIIIIVLFVILITYRYLTYKKEVNNSIEEFDPSKSIHSQINRNVYVGDQLNPNVHKTPEMIEASSRYNNITHILDDSIYDDDNNNNIDEPSQVASRRLQTSDQTGRSSVIDDIPTRHSLQSQKSNNLLDGGSSNFVDLEKIESVTGLNNRWNIKQKDNDFLLDHPLGFDNDFIETTGDSIQYANNKNRKSLDELAKKMFDD
jgi:hypothetical protein